MAEANALSSIFTQRGVMTRRTNGSGNRTIPEVWPLLVIVLCFAVCTASAVVLEGWLRHQPMLAGLFPGHGPMRWTVALATLLLGISILLRRPAGAHRVTAALTDGLVACVLLLVVLSAIQNISGGLPLLNRLGFSGTLSNHPGIAGIPGRMSIGSGTGVGLLALAVLLLDRTRRISTALLSLATLLSLTAVCGFLYKATELFKSSLLDAMAPQTAASLLMLCGAVFAARPTREPMRSLFAPELGAEARMELLVGTWALPLLVGIAVKDALRHGWCQPQFALALFAVTIITVQTCLIWRSDYSLVRLTQNKQKMEEVLRKNEKLAVAGRLAASISHEINNPLESVSNLLYLIRTGDDLDQQHAYADLATEELRRVSQITTQTLSFYRENTSPRASDILPILTSSVQLLRGKISALGVDLVERYRSPMPLVVCSAGELRQVLVNLISNALDATPRGGRIVVRAALSRAWSRRNTPVIRLLVADSGAGMAPAVLARIFEPFYTTKEKTGNGLGLWVAADLVEKHGGWMRVRSSTAGSRRGTTFELVLPVGSEPVPRVQAAANPT